MTLRIDTLPLGPMETNCYVLRSGDCCWVVDPGLWPEPLLEFLQSGRIEPAAIILTHGHGDHIAGIGRLTERFAAARVVCPADDAEMLTDADSNLSAAFGMPITAPPADELIRPGQSLALGGTNWTVLDTSGHTPGGVSFHCPGEKVVITGDALFAGGIGRSDIPGADGGRLLSNIRNNLLVLDDETRVLPGHGPATTIGDERRTNPFLSGR